ncbi:MAG: host attachment protein [Planctomycetaceae bacterium]
MIHSHPSPAVSVTWVLLADCRQARILESESLDFHDLVEIETVLNPVSGLAKSDVPLGGRKAEQVQRRAVADPARKRADDFRTGEQFAAVLAYHLESGRLRQRFRYLLIAAAPTFLGCLRKQMPPVLGRTVIEEIANDLTRASVPELQQRLTTCNRAMQG